MFSGPQGFQNMLVPKIQSQVRQKQPLVSPTQSQNVDVRPSPLPSGEEPGFGCFLLIFLSCSRLGRGTRLGASYWNQAGPCGAPGHKAFLCPPFLWLEEIAFIQPPWPSLSSNSRFKQLLTREGRGCQTREKRSRAALGQGPGSPSKDTHNNIFELFCRYWNPLQVGEVNGMLTTIT